MGLKTGSFWNRNFVNLSKLRITQCANSCNNQSFDS